MASVSFTASSTIAIMIIRSDKGLCSPYSRIIFGLSIADIMQSLGIIISPLAAPSGTLDAPWAMGSTGFCSATGFVLNIGGLLIPFYTLFLTHYFLQRIKYKLTPAQFTRKMELRITICIWLFPVIGSLVGWVNGYFNPSIGGSLCMMIGKPLRCNIDPEIYGDCVRGKKASLASLFLAVLPVILSFAMIIINLARFTFHVYRQEQMFKPTNQEPTNGGSDGNGYIDRTSSAAADAEITIIRDKGRTRRGVPGSLAKQSLVQSSLYIASFIICYFGPIITMIMTALRIPPPAWTVWCVSIFWPLGGFFNILIYTRPKVSRFKESNPEYSRVYVFLIVVLSGGEVPTEIVFGDDQNDFIAERERAERERAERERVLNGIRGNIIEYHVNKANANANEDTPIDMKVSDHNSVPTRSARENSQNLDYKDALKMSSCLSYSRNEIPDNEHNYGNSVTLSVPSVLGRQESIFAEEEHGGEDQVSKYSVSSNLENVQALSGTVSSTGHMGGSDCNASGLSHSLCNFSSFSAGALSTTGSILQNLKWNDDSKESKHCESKERKNIDKKDVEVHSVLIYSR
jgi:hypothetical protein